MRELPQSLVAAFRATLEEATEADLLLLVTDASAPDRMQRRESVLQVLNSIGAAHIPRIEVINKIDLIEQPHNTFGSDTCPLSALNGTGTDELRQRIADALGTGEVHDLTLAPTAAGVRSKLYGLGAVIKETSDADGTMRVAVRVSRERLNTLLKEPGVALGSKP